MSGTAHASNGSEDGKCDNGHYISGLLTLHGITVNATSPYVHPAFLHLGTVPVTAPSQHQPNTSEGGQSAGRPPVDTSVAFVNPIFGPATAVGPSAPHDLSADPSKPFVHPLFMSAGVHGSIPEKEGADDKLTRPRGTQKNKSPPPTQVRFSKLLAVKSVGRVSDLASEGQHSDEEEDMDVDDKALWAWDGSDQMAPDTTTEADTDNGGSVGDVSLEVGAMSKKSEKSEMATMEEYHTKFHDKLDKYVNTTVWAANNVIARIVPDFDDAAEGHHVALVEARDGMVAKLKVELEELKELDLQRRNDQEVGRKLRRLTHLDLQRHSVCI
ncbi:hypothetical protein PLICRDRAFT_177296 [Plicaturopsis crispa FD-325 SS-3]|nr:hypothetical protein PLICRDRAFT_177296 [Plicaturopsis crispa FD-325 SS-3]